MVVLANNAEDLKTIDIVHPLRVLGVRRGFVEWFRLAASRLSARLSVVGIKSL
jgi:hypothetical protein